jgi:hypothetical protein
VPLIASAFGRLHLDRVVATTMAGNIRSWRVLEKCGMRRARTFYYPDADLMPGAEHGDFVYELTRGDWSRQGKHEPSEHGESMNDLRMVLASGTRRLPFRKTFGGKFGPN